MGVICKCCVLCAVLGAGCTKKVNECNADADCKDIAYPFCDVDGQYPASGGDHNVCTVVPPDCPVDRCGCSPGAVACNGDQLSTCNADGMSLSTQACTLGCATDRCASFKPVNGLDSALTLAMTEPAATLPATVTVDTDACTMIDTATNALLPIKSELIAQIAAPKICVFVAAQFDISNVNAKGLNALAFAAPGKVSIRGRIDETAKGRYMANLNAGPGSVTAGTCVGKAGGMEFNEGAGGGGNAGAGGDGVQGGASVPIILSGGLPLADFEPLIGGCEGGESPYHGGGGGGALQIVSLDSIQLLDSGFLAFGGAGGETSGDGGGAGGTILFEAPKVEIAGGIAANGGGGGANGSDGTEGNNATDDEVPAIGGTCSCGAHGGAGGTRSTPPGAGLQSGPNGAGGGGAVGRILIRTADGTFTGPGPIFSIAKTTDTLVKL